MWGRARSATSSDPTVEQLLAAVAVGDDAGFEALYDRTSSRVFGLVRRVLRDVAQAEEVTQEVYLEVWRSAPAFDASRGRGETWILTIAHRRAVDRVRAAQSSTDRELRAARRDVERDFDVVSETVEAHLDVEEVRAALGTLSELQRQAVQLAYYGGYTHSEVAALLGVPLGTVKTRIRDGLIRLRDVMGVTA
jgi:RNA polymerase sigma-70 factor (ECF subfamily)